MGQQHGRPDSRYTSKEKLRDLGSYKGWTMRTRIFLGTMSLIFLLACQSEDFRSSGGGKDQPAVNTKNPLNQDQIADGQSTNVNQSDDVVVASRTGTDTETDTGTDTGTRTGPGAQRTVASCRSADDIVEVGGSVSLQFANANSDEVYTVLLENMTVGPGSVEKTSTVGNVTYRAPASLASDSFIFVKADSSGTDENLYCRIGLARAGSLAISSGSSSRLRLPVAKVFRLPNSTRRLPNYATMTEVQTLKFKDINIPGREFTLGFPGVNNLIEYFGVQYNFNLVIPISGVYEFRISSDDGSRLYINNGMVADLDGWATSSRNTSRSTGSANLTAGTIAGRVDYFQGPGNALGMTLTWRKPGDLNFVPIPPSAFKP
jgi:hypothetical protein